MAAIVAAVAHGDRSMFILSVSGVAEDDAPFRWMKPQGAYPSLGAAIAAAINADVDLDRAVIEKENGVQASVTIGLRFALLVAIWVWVSANRWLRMACSLRPGRDPRNSTTV